MTNACLDELRRRGAPAGPFEAIGDGYRPCRLAPGAGPSAGTLAAVDDAVAGRPEVDGALSLFPPEFPGPVVPRPLPTGLRRDR